MSFSENKITEKVLPDQINPIISQGNYLIFNPLKIRELKLASQPRMFLLTAACC